MSKPRYPWWSYAKEMIRKYPEWENGTIVEGRQDAGCICTQAEIQAVREALLETVRLRDGDSRIMLIQLVFFQKSYTLEGAARLLPGVNYWTARMWHREFIELVGKKRGLLEDLPAAAIET